MKDFRTENPLVKKLCEYLGCREYEMDTIVFLFPMDQDYYSLDENCLDSVLNFLIEKYKDDIVYTPSGESRTILSLWREKRIDEVLEKTRP